MPDFKRAIGLAAVLAAGWAMASLGSSLGCGAGDQSSTDKPSGSGGFNTGGMLSVGGGGQGGSDCETTELCNGIDDTCDGQVDEGCACIEGDSQSCWSGPMGLEGVGQCTEGTQICDVDGSWGACEGEVLPDPSETCDGVDNDCNMEIDEGFGSLTCGLGVCQVTVDECTDGTSNPCIPGTPGTETCDGSDDDCDGQVDEGCTCVNGTTQPCYTGSPSTQNVGACMDGLQTCTSGQWGACQGDVTPTTETCNNADDDCDGMTDEGNPDGGAMCSSGQLGVCAVGTQTCVNGGLQCVQNNQPTTETCNGLDDDCDGLADDGNPGGGGMCSTGMLGVCLPGTFVCQGGMLACVQNVTPTAESCNGLDDDCDGMTDEGNPGGGGNCSTGQFGICAAGTQQCQGGGLVCVPTNTATSEVCNGLDDDCDNAVDEGDPGGGGMCSTGNPGVCGNGTQHCVGGQVVCQQNVTPSPESCNGLDDDCDGQTDENNPGGGGGCNTGQLGICGPGIQTCQNGSLSCVASNMATAESCNNLDDDCDGMTDENNPGGGGMCSSGQPGICSPGTQTCQNGGLVCIANNMPVPEICNNVDDDCDGVVDDGNPGGGSACNTGQPGICSTGTQTCVSGMIQCVANNSPTSEICNNLDDDCDGIVDDGNPGGGASCNTGNQGICAAGTLTCQGGGLTCVQNSMATTENCSNGLDDDCDGLTDGADPNCGCSHNVCTQGTPLISSCNSCTAQICAVDAYCCNTGWDSICVNEVSSVCGSSTCAGTCAHAPCTAGAALTSGCDVGGADCVAQICAVDSFCCTNSWDSICVGEVSSVCGNTCTVFP